MSRWGRGRSGSVAVPLDSALFRENSNCPSAARSAGTVGKWGITSFTSIRNAPYSYASTVHKKPVQDQNSPLTVPAVDSEQPPPKPKKFFKSRNSEPYPPVPQITYAPPVPAAPLSPEHPGNSKDKKSIKRSRIYNRGDSSSPELPKRSEKTKTRKNSVGNKASKKDEVPADKSQPPNKRYLVRNRDKVINYAEDGSNSPIPDFTSRYEPLIPKSTSPKRSPLVSSPTPTKTESKVEGKPEYKPEVASPSTSKDTNEERKPPPIVLRISKGTSRIVSTDSNEGFTSPGSDRHSSMDIHSDVGSDHKRSPPMESICSPKHEGLKITIKCATLTQEGKKDKKKEKKEGHKSHKRHHKYVDDENTKKITSPVPGSDSYELYKTLASPVHENSESNKEKGVDEIETELAKLDSTEQMSEPVNLQVHPTEQPPEPKPPEATCGRSRRNRPNINYSENDDYLDALTTSYSTRQSHKTVGELRKDTRKAKKKQEPASTDLEATSTSPSIKADQHLDLGDKKDLIDILSGTDESKADSGSQKIKTKKQKQKQANSKHSSPIQNTDSSPNNEIEEHNEENDQDSSHADQIDEIDQMENIIENQIQATTHSQDSAYNSCPNDLVEEDLVKDQQEEEFKSPHDMCESESNIEDKPSVKLVITKKKGSIFKSKSLVNDSTASPLPARKRRHLYRHEWANDKGNETPRPEATENTEVRNPVAKVSQELTRVTRYRAPDPVVDDIDSDTIKPYTSVKCPKESKEYYTVVRNVKKAHQIQEIGEFQEFNDDVDYLLDALQDNNPISTRCLSAITLASKCTAPAFRMHLRAHGTVQKFFSSLHDATNDQSLGLCTATVMFVLSQDRLNMDLDRESLELMLNLLESDVSHKNALDDCGLTSAQLAKTQERVRELCAEIKNQGKATHLDLENITVGHLAMETLLSLTSKRAGEWFKEELRVLGGVDHIVRTIQDCAERLEAPANTWSPADIDVLRKADRCMRVLENVTQQNEDNQLYLVGSRLGAARTLAALLRRCAGEARRATPTLRTALLDAALPAVKVLVNLSHSFGTAVSLGAQVVGEQPSLMEISLIILNNQGNFIPDDKNFEFSVCENTPRQYAFGIEADQVTASIDEDAISSVVELTTSIDAVSSTTPEITVPPIAYILVLLLLINLVQNNEVNTQRLLSVRIQVDNDGDVISRSVPALDLIIDLFYKREELAKRAEENTDALLDGEKEPEEEKDKDNKKNSQDDIDETVAKLLARAGAHMEHTMVGAYTALLLGHAGAAVTSAAGDAGVASVASVARGPLAGVRYAPLLPTLRKYYAFLNLTASAEATIAAHVKATHRIIQFMEESEKQSAEREKESYSYSGQYYQSSPSDVPQDMSLSSLNYNYTSSDRIPTMGVEYH